MKPSIVFPFFFFPIVLHTKLRDEWTAIYGRKLGKSEKKERADDVKPTGSV